MTTKFQTIIVDPPWSYNQDGSSNLGKRQLISDGSREQRGAGSAERYGALSIGELRSLNIGDVATDNAHLYLWTTNSFICEAHELARAWGFVPKTVITWGKIRADGQPSRKMGYWYRSATEHVVFAVRGKLRLNEQASREVAPSTLFLHGRLPHSVKPDAFYEMVETYSPGPYLDVFARRDRPGWMTWGDEAPHGETVGLLVGGAT